MSVLVGFLRDGAIIAAIANTEVEAVGELADVYGNDVLNLYNEARKTLLEEASGSPRVVAPVPRPVALPDSDGSDGGAASEATEVSEAGQATDEEGTPSPAQGAGGSEDPVGGGHVCAVCATKVASGRAELSLELYAEIRCKLCSG